MYRSGGQDRNALVEQRVARLDKEIDTAVAKIEEKEAKLEGLRAERRQAVVDGKTDLAQVLKEDFESLEQSIADLKARLQSKEQERRELTQSLLGRSHK